MGSWGNSYWGNLWRQMGNQSADGSYQRKPQPLDKSSLPDGGVDEDTINNAIGIPQDEGTAGMDAISSMNQKSGLRDLSAPGAGTSVNMWNAPESMAGGKLVTTPTYARLGERGPEAVIPLTPRPGNKVQPDLLEGHITNPKVPGVRYSRYKGYNRFGGGGGQV